MLFRMSSMEWLFLFIAYLLSDPIQLLCGLGTGFSTQLFLPLILTDSIWSSSPAPTPSSVHTLEGKVACRLEVSLILDIVFSYRKRLTCRFKSKAVDHYSLRVSSSKLASLLSLVAATSRRPLFDKVEQASCLYPEDQKTGQSSPKSYARYN